MQPNSYPMKGLPRGIFLLIVNEYFMENTALDSYQTQRKILNSLSYLREATCSLLSNVTQQVDLNALICKKSRCICGKHDFQCRYISRIVLPNLFNGHLIYF